MLTLNTIEDRVSVLLTELVQFVAGLWAVCGGFPQTGTWRVNRGQGARAEPTKNCKKTRNLFLRWKRIEIDDKRHDIVVHI